MEGEKGEGGGEAKAEALLLPLPNRPPTHDDDNSMRMVFFLVRTVGLESSCGGNDPADGRRSFKFCPSTPLFFFRLSISFSPLPLQPRAKKSHIGSRRGPSLLFRQAALRALMEGKIRGREKWKMRGKTHCDNGPFIIPRDLERGAAPPLQAGRPPRKFFMGRKKVNWATKKRHKHKLFSRPCPQCPASGRPPFPNPLSPTSTQTLLPPPPSSSCFKA